MNIGDKVIAIKELTGYDPSTFLPFPMVLVGMPGEIIRKLERIIGEQEVIGLGVRFENGTTLAMMENKDGTRRIGYSLIEEQIRLA